MRAASPNAEPARKSPGPVSSDSPLLPHLPLIERVIRHICRRNCLSPDEAEDFASWMRVKLVESGEDILRKHDGRGTLETYLTVVVQRRFLDYRIEKWGKWRPSAAAKRLGEVAVGLERLVVKEGIPFEQAAEILRRNHGVTLSVAELAALGARLYLERTQRPAGEDEIGDVADPRRADDAVRLAERRAAAIRACQALEAALQQLDEHDRLIVKMCYLDGHSVAAVARRLEIDQKPLYPRLTRLKEQLRGQLESQGITREMVCDLIGEPEVEIRLDVHHGAEGRRTRPSSQRRGP